MPNDKYTIRYSIDTRTGQRAIDAASLLVVIQRLRETNRLTARANPNTYEHANLLADSCTLDRLIDDVKSIITD